MGWTDLVATDPLPWLLEDDVPAVRAATLVRLLDDPRVRAVPASRALRTSTSRAAGAG